MQLSASRYAQFFIQEEFQQVEVKDQCIILSSPIDEVQIPFVAWSGEITIERGLVWGNLYFHAHEEENEQIKWLVQGLPWEQCQIFAQQAIGEYRLWQNNQTESLVELLPDWIKQLHELVNQPSYFTHSSLQNWISGIESDLADKDMSLSDVIHLFPSEEDNDPEDIINPSLMSELKRWLTHSEASLEQRNQIWVSNQEEDWQEYFQSCESSPLNPSQQKAVLLNDDHTLVLAGAGSGKTSVLMAKVGYLLKSEQAKANDILLLAFGREAAKEMQQRILEKFGESAAGIKVQTFHQLGLDIIKQVEGDQVEISPLATNPKQKSAWFSQWLKTHWMTETNFKRWKKHLFEWPIAFLKGDVDLGSQAENPKLLAWLEQQVDQLSSVNLSKKKLQEQLIHLEDYPRLNSELMLAWPCYQAWQKMLKDDNQIDFNKMISKANQYARNGKFTPRWRYVMVDEYQDISPNRLDLLDTICQKSINEIILGETITKQPCALFAVGDDWQAIYRFAGADVNLTTGFEKRFTHAKIHNLDTTYRFNNQIGEVANNFVQRNPHQLSKTLNSFKHQKQKAVTVAPMASLEKILGELNNANKPRVKVLLLGRNHYHEPRDLKKLCQLNPHLDIEFKTCHASKGQEADYVILVSFDEGQFPAVKRQNHLSDALLASEVDFPYAEERRLFYVAMTRAKEKVWLLHNGLPSVFITELKASRFPVIFKKR